MDGICVFCQREGVELCKHHIVPRSKGGKETVLSCKSCENFIHKTWSHKELLNKYNTVDSILSDEKFRTFLDWLKKQKNTSFFPSKRNKTRTKHPFR